MKHLLVTLFSFLSVTCFAQKLPNEGLYKVRIAQPDETIVAEINPVSSIPSVKVGLFYYWYEANMIHKTQSGFSGKLLNGLYDEYYPDKNLKEQGSFKRGLKNGVWKSWNDDGTLLSETRWKNGVRVSLQETPIWKRLNFLKKRDTSAVDTVKKTGK